MTQTLTLDTTGDPTRVVYAKSGVEWVNDSQSSNIHGQWRWHTGPAGWELYGYDPAGRLGVVWDQRAGQGCVQRGYDYDLDSNRTASHAWPANATGDCPPSTTPTSTTHAYDAADRLLPQGVDAGLAYGAFGRIITLPASDAGGTAASIGYYVTGMVASQTQGAATRSWTLDPAGRLRQATASGASTRLNHYDDASSDSPAWINEDTGAATLSATRYVAGLDGNLAAAVTHTGTSTSARWQLVNLHGDVVSSAADDPALTTPDGPTLDADEFGNPRSAATARYGWLGGKQRSTDSLAGLVLMGVRLCDPVLGRFLQVDPEPGGSANDYDYANQDPINNFDLDGKRCWSPRCAWHTVTHKASQAWHATTSYVSTHRMGILQTAGWFGTAACGFFSGGMLVGVCGGLVMAGTRLLSYRYGQRRHSWRGYFWQGALGFAEGYGAARIGHYLRRVWLVHRDLLSWGVAGLAVRDARVDRRLSCGDGRKRDGFADGRAGSAGGCGP